MMEMYDFSVMPTINEDAASSRGSFGNGDEVGIEHLMVNMLDERDKLMEALNSRSKVFRPRHLHLYIEDKVEGKLF
jgi:hypothetical protein